VVCFKQIIPPLSENRKWFGGITKGGDVFKKIVERSKKILGIKMTSAEMEKDISRARVERAARSLDNIGRLSIQAEPRWFRS
tara:strand:+ start:567 stop:812 length:246 start_codon:yes stop_codon:yes gene_type:complete